MFWLLFIVKFPFQIVYRHFLNSLVVWYTRHIYILYMYIYFLFHCCCVFYLDLVHSIALSFMHHPFLSSLSRRYLLILLLYFKSILFTSNATTEQNKPEHWEMWMIWCFVRSRTSSFIFRVFSSFWITISCICSKIKRWKDNTHRNREKNTTKNKIDINTIRNIRYFHLYDGEIRILQRLQNK